MRRFGRFFLVLRALELRQFLSIGILFFLLFSLVLSLDLSGKRQDIRKRAAGITPTPSVTKERKPPLSRGFLVEFLNEPFTSFYERTEEASKSSNELKSTLQGYRSVLEAEHKSAKMDIEFLLGKKIDNKLGGNLTRTGLSVLGEYTETFNGVALDITNEEADKLKKSSFVKNVYPNLRVEASLMDSIPQIKADEVWRMKDEQGRNITGEGTKIAVIDTGVDYTHPDLGGTVITERNFQKITREPLDFDTFHEGDLNFDNYLMFDGNRLVYPVRNVIYIYSFDDPENILSIPVFAPDLEAVRVFMKGNLLAYGAITDVGGESKTGFFLYNLATREHIRLAETIGMGSLSISEGKVIYGADTPSTGNQAMSTIYIYDTVTKETISLPYAANTILMPVASGNLVAYNKHTPEGGYQSFVIYDMNTGLSREIIPVEQGPIIDFKGSKILYVAFNPQNFDPLWKSYYLYDINTGSYQKLLFQQVASQGGKIEAREITSVVASWINKGTISDNLVFFSKNVFANTIIAYDRTLNRYVQINLLRRSLDFDVSGNKVCFTSYDKNIYCHDYNPSESYPLPERIYNSKVTDGYNFVLNDNDPLDDHGHGTHVAAIAAGNGILKGVAPGARLLAYKALDAYGSGYYSDIIAAIEMAVRTKFDSDPNNDVNVINMSLGADCKGNDGGYTSWCGPDDSLSRAVDNAVKAGIVAAVAAGNSGYGGEGSINSPGTARLALTVGAVDKSNNIPEFSSRGPVVWLGETILKPDVVAPGVKICAAEYDDVWPHYKCFDDKHVVLGGTSMAAPHVAGVAALIKQAEPSFTALPIKNLIKSGARNLGLDPNSQGKGLIDAQKSVLLAKDYGIPKNLKVKCLPTQAEITWESPGSNFRYALRLDDKVDPWKTCSSPDFCVETPNTWYHFDFTPGRTYRWWMHSIDQNGFWSRPVVGLEFTCNIVAPTPTPTPVSGLPTNLQVKCLERQAEITWKGVPNTKVYALRLDDAIDGWKTCSSPDFCVETPNTWYHFDFTPGRTYRWWMHSIDNNGNWSNLVAGPNFTCPYR